MIIKHIRQTVFREDRHTGRTSTILYLNNSFKMNNFLFFFVCSFSRFINTRFCIILLHCSLLYDMEIVTNLFI